jgi:hypothetical protein
MGNLPRQPFQLGGGFGRILLVAHPARLKPPAPGFKAAHCHAAARGIVFADHLGEDHMRLFACLAGFALLLAPMPAAAGADFPGTMEALAREKTIWQAVKDQKLDDFAAAMAPDYVGVYPNGPRTTAADVAQIKGVALHDFEISFFVVHPIDPETIATTYRIDVSGQVGGAAFTGRYWVSSVWHLGGGKWRAVLHTETLAAPN